MKNLQEEGEQKSNEFVMNRMKKTDKIVKSKFHEQFTSVTKAFLEVDQNYDGLISAEDIAKFIGGFIDFKELEFLVKNRDSKKIGRLDFKDFCKWLGTSIEPCEGFYFRHDSVKNPQYEGNIKR
jgi:Ca2+-binding EF-hand superfamily protein